MRRIPLVLAALALSAALPPAASGAGFSFGVAAGEVTSSSAQMWAHATSKGSTTLQVSRARTFRRLDATKTVPAVAASDLTVQAKVSGLKAGTAYYYRWTQGSRRSAVGSFKTAPSATSDATIRFAWSGDADAQRARGASKPFYNRFEVYARMARERNNFNVNMGDTIYSDSEVGAAFVNGTYFGSDPALTRAQKWAKYKQNLALSNLTMLRAATGLYSHPDDHEWINDFGQNESLSARNARGRDLTINGRSLYMPGVQAFGDYAPTGWTKSNGYYRSFRWGKNVEVFFLDERSFRSAKAGSPTIHTCDNPDTHAPDLAPTAPASTRGLFAAVVPSLRQPVSPACLSAINDPSRTMLGSRQFAAFTAAIKRSTATWKVIMNEVPIMEIYSLPYDRWEGYAAERTKLLQFLQANVKNTVFLTTDHHANLVTEAQTNTLRDNGTPTVHYGILDVATGPVATMTYRKEINAATGQDAQTGTNGDLIDSAFFDQAPPGGLGMNPFVNPNTCSALDVFSYGQVTASSTQFKVELKDLNGQPIHDSGSTRPVCGPYVLNKQ